MNAEIVSVGTEIVLGRIVDTNAAHISRRLTELGIRVIGHVAVEDERERMLCALRDACSRAVLVIVTGGLGPTRDDLTRDVVAEFCGTGLRQDPDSVERMRQRFAKRGLPLSPNNLVQALIPDGGEVIPNLHGTAAGFAIRHGDTEIIALPGVPSEMMAMFEEWVVPHLRQRLPQRPEVAMRELHTFGLPESLLGEKIADLMEPGRNPIVGTQVKDGVITVRAVVHSPDPEEAEQLLERTVAKLRERLGDVIFGEGACDNLAEAVALLLERSGCTLAVAESCTGGLICDMLTDVPGISRFLLEGVVAYSNRAKTERLGVSPELFETVGAVSREVALAMAHGVRARSGASIGLGVTGIAGPSGATPSKPVGLVHIAVADERGEEAIEVRLLGGRRQIKDRAAKYALNQVRLRLLHRVEG